jgi:hypothetical protein
MVLTRVRSDRERALPDFGMVLRRVAEYVPSAYPSRSDR